MRRIAAPIVLLALATLACEDVIPPKLYNTGDPCRTNRDFCIDDEITHVCEDNIWTEQSCDSVCAALGPSYLADGCEQRCNCVLADPDACVPGETECVDDQTLGLCSELQTLETTSCAQICAATGREPVGCMAMPSDNPYEDEPAACWCTGEGTPCAASEAPSCVDETQIARCINEVWVFEDCAAGCEGAGFCDPWRSPPDCAC